LRQWVSTVAYTNTIININNKVKIETL
jgi:hypothetical protein